MAKVEVTGVSTLPKSRLSIDNLLHNPVLHMKSPKLLPKLSDLVVSCANRSEDSWILDTVHGNSHLIPSCWNALRLHVNLLRFLAVMFSWLSCLQDLTIHVPCSHLPYQPHANGGRWNLWTMVSCSAFVVPVPACLFLLQLTELRHPTQDCRCPRMTNTLCPQRCKVQLMDVAVTPSINKPLHRGLC